MACNFWGTLTDPLFLADEVEGNVLVKRSAVRMKAPSGAERICG